MKKTVTKAKQWHQWKKLLQKQNSGTNEKTCYKNKAVAPIIIAYN